MNVCCNTVINKDLLCDHIFVYRVRFIVCSFSVCVSMFNVPCVSTELNQARARAEKWNSEQSRSDRAVREMRAQVDDLTQALTAKDSQLAILRVRLDEADQLLKARSSALEEAQSERTRYLS